VSIRCAHLYPVPGVDESSRNPAQLDGSLQWEERFDPECPVGSTFRRPAGHAARSSLESNWQLWTVLAVHPMEEHQLSLGRAAGKVRSSLFVTWGVFRCLVSGSVPTPSCHSLKHLGTCNVPRTRETSRLPLRSSLSFRYAL
jgi:hypothetical protein